MAALLAHALALHQDGIGQFAPAHESAHVAYHLARNWVQNGVLAWGQEIDAAGVQHWVGGIESHPSPMLVLAAAIAERILFPVTTFCQVAGVLAVLLTVALSASFATDRIAGIIPALLLVASGGIAAGAASGTEIPFLTLGMAATFVAFEHRWRRRFSIALLFLVLARADGAIVVAAYFALALAERAIHRRDRSPPMALWAFIPAFAVMGALALARGSDGRSVLVSMLLDVCNADLPRLQQGASSVRDFVLGTGVPLLAVFPIVALLFRRLSGAGVRALLLAALWIVIVVLEGGGPPEFGLAFVPALPVLFVAVQQGIIGALDTHWRVMEALSWAVLLAAVVISALASKFPGDLGPLPLERVHRQWMRASATAPFGRQGVLGRLALNEEIAITSQLRELATWLQHEVPAERSVLTPFPGVLGYLSRARIHDLFQRTGGATDGRTSLTWWFERPVDVLAALEERPDYVLPGLVSVELIGSRTLPESLARELMRADQDPSSEERLRAARKLLEDYELLSVPLWREDSSRRIARSQPFFLLRRKDRGPGFALSANLAADRLTVDLTRSRTVEDTSSDGLPQLARLRITATDDRGQSWQVDPAGGLTPDPRVSTRIGLLLQPSGSRPTRLFDSAIRVPPEVRVVELHVALLNPGTRGGHFLAELCEEASVSLPH
jgi:hypothetical protein